MSDEQHSLVYTPSVHYSAVHRRPYVSARYSTISYLPLNNIVPPYRPFRALLRASLVDIVRCRNPFLISRSYRPERRLLASYPPGYVKFYGNQTSIAYDEIADFGIDIFPLSFVYPPPLLSLSIVLLVYAIVTASFGSRCPFHVPFCFHTVPPSPLCHRGFVISL